MTVPTAISIRKHEYMYPEGKQVQGEVKFYILEQLYGSGSVLIK